MTLKPEIIVIAGPTAVGKTALAIALAKAINAEILSCDSRQIYREMSIGTAKPNAEELSEVKQHFVNHISVETAYSVGDFEREASAFLESYFTKKKSIILCGGSGLFIDSLLYGMDNIPKVDSKIRNSLNEKLQLEGLDSLVLELQKIDENWCKTADLKNPRRVIRALEVYYQSGKPISFFQKKEQISPKYNCHLFCLNLPRNTLYERIDKRVVEMIAAGLEAEVRELESKKHLQALQTVGYREWFEAWENKESTAQIILKIQQNSRRYAKRQLTWFRRNKDYQWIENENLDSSLNQIRNKLLSK